MTRGGHENCTSESFETVLITKERERVHSSTDSLSIVPSQIVCPKMSFKSKTIRPGIGLLDRSNETITKGVPKLSRASDDRDLSHRKHQVVVTLVRNRPVVFVLKHGCELLMNVRAARKELGDQVHSLRVSELS